MSLQKIPVPFSLALQTFVLYSPPIVPPSPGRAAVLSTLFGRRQDKESNNRHCIQIRSYRYSKVGDEFRFTNAIRVRLDTTGDCPSRSFPTVQPSHKATEVLRFILRLRPTLQKNVGECLSILDTRFWNLNRVLAVTLNTPRCAKIDGE
jgi:hypothetical protein